MFYNLSSLIQSFMHKQKKNRIEYNMGKEKRKENRKNTKTIVEVKVIFTVFGEFCAKHCVSV